MVTHAKAIIQYINGVLTLIDPPISFAFSWFYRTHMCVRMCPAVQFYCMCRFASPPPLSRWWALSSQLPPSPCLLLLPNTKLFSLFKTLSFQKFYINGILQYVTFGDWPPPPPPLPPPLSVISLRFIHSVKLLHINSLLCSSYIWIIIYHGIDVPQFI